MIENYNIYHSRVMEGLTNNQNILVTHVNFFKDIISINIVKVKLAYVTSIFWLI